MKPPRRRTAPGPLLALGLSVLVPGGASHFADAQRLGTDETPAPYRESGHVVERPTDLYSTDFYTDKLIEHLSQAHADGRPFFLPSRDMSYALETFEQ